MPNFNSTPAKTTEPAVGASVWAKGNQVCTGNNGTLTAKPANMAIMTQNCSVAERSTEAKAVNAGMSKLHPPLASANRQATYARPAKVNIDPVKVYKKNLMDADARLLPPQPAIRKYIGTRVNSKAT